MTLRQRRIIAILALVDIAIILGLVLIVTRPFPFLSSAFPPSHQACQWKATQSLAGAGLGGTVELGRDGSLRFEIMVPLAPGETSDGAAQAVWTAFDIALSLKSQEAECAIFNQVEVQVLAQDGQRLTCINASVSAQDLIALGSGALTEDEFIELVAYTTSVSSVP